MRLLKYQRLKPAILNWIAKNELKVGDRLPSERDITELFGFSRITVRRTLTDLVESGYLESFPQSGYFLKRPIAPEKHGLTLGFLRIGRAGMLSPDYPVERLCRSFPFYEMHSRSIEVIARYEEDPEIPFLNYFFPCAGLLMTDWVTDEWVTRARELDVPLYCVGNNLCEKEMIPTIDYDYEYTVREILSVLFAHGCRKIVIVLSSLTMPSASTKERAYREFFKERGVCFEERRIVRLSHERGDEDYMEGLMANRDCDAVICEKVPNIFQYKYLHWKKLPKFAFFSCEHPNGNRYVRAVFPYYPKDLYAEAANILVKHIQTDCELPEKLLLRPEISDRL